MAKANKRGPESVFLDTLKGEEVLLGLDTGIVKEVRVKLLWVDTYSYGVEWGRRGEVLVPKHAVSYMFKADGLPLR